jgi:hypothetical protein
MNRKLQLDGIKEISFPADTVRVLVVKSDPPADALGEVMGEVVIAKLEELKTARAIKELSVLTEPALVGPFKQNRGTYKAQATFAEFKARMKEKPEVVHFIGHGRRSGGHGQLAFVGEDGLAQWVDEDEFRDTVCHDGLRLVFLQACESALPDPHAPMSGLAISLARRGVPAVVAMQAKVKNDIADEFATQFYEALAVPSPVDVAVKVGRDQVRQQLKKSANGERFTAFGIPVLFLRSYENLIQVNTAGSRPLPAGRPAEDEAKRPKFCGECGAGLGPQSNFCSQCGKAVVGGRQGPVTAGGAEFVGEAPRASTVQTEPKLHDNERVTNLGYGESAGGGGV